jgi:adenine phosphoribosyltransferase
MSTQLSSAVQAAIRDVPDFPKPGILFKDITPVLSDGALFAQIIDHLADRYGGRNLTQIVAIESRGFLFGTALAYRLGIGVVPVRKPGKLPYESISVDYALEYGSDTLEMHVDALEHHDNVVVIDDLLATGGTASAAVELVAQSGANIEEIAFLVELDFLGGRAKLAGNEIHSIVSFG